MTDSHAALLISNAVKVRLRLMKPKNAVKDTGINLRRPPDLESPAAPQKPPAVLPPPTMKPRPCIGDMRLMVWAASQHFGIEVRRILSSDRKMNVVLPRQIAMYLCREDILVSYPKMALLFKKDHTTILHAYYKIKRLIDASQILSDHVKAVRSLYERYSTRPAIPAERQPNLAVQLRWSDGSQGPVIRGLAEGMRSFVDGAATAPIREDNGPVQSGYSAGKS